VVDVPKDKLAWILFGLMLSMFLANLDQTIIATCLPAMARDLDGWALLPWVVSAYLVTSTAMTPIYGRLSDRYGRRRVLLGSIAIFVGSSALCALAPTMPLLVAARTIQGIGGGGLRSIAQVIIADIIPPRDRGRYQGYMSTTFLVSTTLGPVLGGLIATHATWPWIFWINLPLGALAYAVIHRQLRILPLPTLKPSIDWIGAVLVLLGAAPLLIGLSRVEQYGGFGSAEVLAPVVVGVIAAGALVVVELRAEHPMVPIRLLGIRNYGLTNLLLFVASLAMTGMIIIVPLDYQLAQQWPADEAGLQLIALTGGMAGGSFVVGSLVSRLGRARAFPIIGAAATALVCTVIGVVGLGRSTVFDLLCIVLLGASFGWQINPAIVVAQNALQPNDMASGVSGMTFLRSLGGAFGVAAMMTFLIGRLAEGAAGLPNAHELGADLGVGLLRAAEAGKIGPEAEAQALALMQHAFSAVFFLAAILSLASLAVAITVQETTLRSSAPRSSRRFAK
jgi:EmrB/QacA subfamily drug resistance transporter